MFLILAISQVLEAQNIRDTQTYSSLGLRIPETSPIKLRSWSEVEEERRKFRPGINKAMFGNPSDTQKRSVRWGEEEDAIEKPTVILTKKSDMFLARAVINVPISIPLHQVEEHCSDLQSIFRTRTPKGTTSGSTKRQWTLLKTKINTGCEEVHDKFQQLLADSTKNERFAFSLIGTGLGIIGSVFSWVQSFQSDDIKHDIQMERYQRQQQADVVMDELKKMKDGLSRAVSSMRRMDDELKTQELIFELSLAADSVQREADNIFQGIFDARGHKLSPALITPKQLKALHQNISKEAERAGGLPIIFSIADYYSFPVSLALLGDKEVAVIIHVPVARKKLELFKLTAIPFEYEGKTFIMDKPTKLFAMDKEREWHTTVTDGFLEACMELGPHFICFESLPLKKRVADSCEGAMFLANMKNIHDNCDFKELQRLTVVSMPKGAAVFSPDRIRVSIKCSQRALTSSSGKQEQVLSIQGLNFLPVSRGCVVKGEEFELYKPTSLKTGVSIRVTLDWTTYFNNTKKGTMQDWLDKENEQIESIGKTIRELETSIREIKPEAVEMEGKETKIVTKPVRKRDSWILPTVAALGVGVILLLVVMITLWLKHMINSRSAATPPPTANVE